MSDQASSPADLRAAKYVSFTTYRKNGDPVATPVWIASDGKDLVFVSVDNVGKTERLAHTAAVQLQPCDLRGNVSADAATYHGTAIVQRGSQDVKVVRKALQRKYFSARILNAMHALVSRVGSTKPRVAIRISLN